MEKTRNKYKRENSYLELYNDDFYNGISLKSGTFSSHCKGGVNLKMKATGLTQDISPLRLNHVHSA